MSIASREIEAGGCLDEVKTTELSYVVPKPCALDCGKIAVRVGEERASTPQKKSCVAALGALSMTDKISSNFLDKYTAGDIQLSELDRHQAHLLLIDVLRMKFADPTNGLGGEYDFDINFAYDVYLTHKDPRSRELLMRSMNPSTRSHDFSGTVHAVSPLSLDEITLHLPDLGSYEVNQAINNVVAVDNIAVLL